MGTHTGVTWVHNGSEQTEYYRVQIRFVGAWSNGLRVGFGRPLHSVADAPPLRETLAGMIFSKSIPFP